MIYNVYIMLYNILTKINRNGGIIYEIEDGKGFYFS